MESKYEEYLNFNWSDERWQKYLDSLYPAPNFKQIQKFKKKWYKKTIDPDFDDNFEPEAPAASTTSVGEGGSATYQDTNRWGMMGKKASICFAAYAVAIAVTVIAAAGALPPTQALVMMVSAFVLEILAKYGLKFSTHYLQSVLLDDVGVMPMMALTLLTPGLHTGVRLLALVPHFLTALMSFAQICKAHAALPESVREFFSPLAEPSARYKIMQARADAEVLLGFVLIVGVFTGRAAPISALLFWNFMMMRHMMSAWTQATFRKLDGIIDPILGRIPLVGNGYRAMKRALYSFVDPEKRRNKTSSFCSIL